MSFGAPIIDSLGVIQPYPALSLVTGLLANALGYHHRESGRLQRLQERIRYASRRDRRGAELRDYQTADLGADYMNDNLAWTTSGALEKRRGGTASSGTHIRLRDYLVDSAHTLAITLDSAEEAPTIEDLEKALREPARPLFIGRKTCLPSGPLFLSVTESEDLISALRQAPLVKAADPPPYRVWYGVDDPEPRKGVEIRPVSDRRDWKNQIHTGQRWLASTEIDVTAQEAHDG